MSAFRQKEGSQFAIALSKRAQPFPRTGCVLYARLTYCHAAALSSAQGTQLFHARPLRWRPIVRHEEVDLQRLTGIGAIAVEVGDALLAEERVVDQEIATEGL